MKTVGRRGGSGVPGGHRHTGDSLLFVAGEKRRHDEPGIKEGDREEDRVRGKALLLDLERRLRSRWRKRSISQGSRKVE